MIEWAMLLWFPSPLRNLRNHYQSITHENQDTQPLSRCFSQTQIAQLFPLGSRIANKSSFYETLATFLASKVPIKQYTNIKLHLIGFESIKFLQWISCCVSIIVIMHSFNYRYGESLQFLTSIVQTISSNLLLTFSIVLSGPDSDGKKEQNGEFEEIVSTKLYILTNPMVFLLYENSSFASPVL